MNIVDAHPHIYSADLLSYPTVDDPWEPGESAEVADLKLRMDDAGVARAVFIQTSTYYGHDNRYVMASSQANSSGFALTNAGYGRQYRKGWSSPSYK